MVRLSPARSAAVPREANVSAPAKTPAARPSASRRLTPARADSITEGLHMEILLPQITGSGVSLATGQQSGHLDKSPQVALRLGHQAAAHALIHTFNGNALPLRLLEGRPYHRLGDGTHEAGISRGVSRHITTTPILHEEGRRNLQRLGTIDREHAAYG